MPFPRAGLIVTPMNTPATSMKRRKTPTVKIWQQHSHPRSKLRCAPGGTCSPQTDMAIPGVKYGAISYMDTMEIVAFVARYPQFRPAPLAQLASAYYVAWRSLKDNFQPDRHLLNIFGYGLGHYDYINPQREWQQTTGFFGKVANSQYYFEKALKQEGIKSLATPLALPTVARFAYFRKQPRPAGVWLVRGELCGSPCRLLPARTRASPIISRPRTAFPVSRPRSSNSPGTHTVSDTGGWPRTRRRRFGGRDHPISRWHWPSRGMETMDGGGRQVERTHQPRTHHRRELENPGRLFDTHRNNFRFRACAPSRVLGCRALYGRRLRYSFHRLASRRPLRLSRRFVAGHGEKH